jgi:hypothetical protein
MPRISTHQYPLTLSSLRESHPLTENLSIGTCAHELKSPWSTKHMFMIGTGGLFVVGPLKNPYLNFLIWVSMRALSLAWLTVIWVWLALNLVLSI